MISKTRTKITKRYSWRKNGWASSNNTGVVPGRSKVYSNISDFDSIKTGMAEIDLYTEAQEKIQIGSCQEALDLLPPSIQHILRDPYNWYLAPNGKLFKALDPETQARGMVEHHRDPEWGYDSEEKFKESATYQGLDRVAEKWLKDHKQQLPICSREDILGQLGDENYDFTPSRPIEQVDTEISELYFDGYKHIISERETTKAEVIEDISIELTNRLNSPYCGFGYTQPKQRWIYIWDVANNTEFTDAAEAREERFKRYLNQILKCQNMSQLYGSLIQTENGYSRGGGLYGKIRKLFNEDKEIITNWSINDQYDKEGNLVSKSQFTIDKEKRIFELKEIETDEEKIRKIIWHEFTKERETIPAHYNKNGEWVNKKTIQDSSWRKERNEAFKELNFTQKQKGALWEATKRVREKFKQPENISIKDKVNLAFSKVRTLYTLKIFKEWIYKRQFGFDKEYIIRPNGEKVLISQTKNYKFTDSIVDQLSINQTNRLEYAIGNRETHIKLRNMFFLELDKKTFDREGILTKLSETGLECTCNRWVVDSPKFITTENNKGYLYLDCDCGKKVWIMNFKLIKQEPLTLERLINDYNKSSN